MWKQFAEYVLSFLNLARDTHANTAAIQALRQETDDLAATVEKLSFEIRATSERERHEREKFMLRVENALLRFERSLAEGKSRKRK